MIVEAALDKKASEILLLDAHEQCIFADYFLLCNGESDRQIKALSNGIVDEVKQATRSVPMGVEGKAEDGWVLLDYGHIIVHIFSPDQREYYNLEELWDGARVVLRVQ